VGRIGESQGPWARANNPPAELNKIKTAAIAANQNQVLGNDEQSLKDAYEDREAPAVYVSTSPAELILTQGEPVFAAIPGTTLSYVTNTADDIFRDGGARRDYVLIGGRWLRRRLCRMARGRTSRGRVCPPTSR